MSHSERVDEKRCAYLIDQVRLFTPRGGSFIAHPDLYTEAEVRIANESAQRVNPNVSIVRGTITVDGVVTNRVAP